LQLRDNNPVIAYPNTWSFFGGEIDLGETPWQALQRELDEEISWRPKQGEILYEWVNLEYPCQVHFFSVIFNEVRSQLVLQEGQQLGWFKLTLMKKTSNIIPHVIQHIINHKKQKEKIENFRDPKSKKVIYL
tara:strand:+ start:182 stop:577 length:396 start_codon:yes stop_codon:yes gene_type:complete